MKSSANSFENEGESLMKPQLLKSLSIAPLLILFSTQASASWICEEAASIKSAQFITVCGIGEDTDEDKARKAALTNAFTELDMICNRSADCRDFELIIEPLRNECKKTGDKLKCYRAIHVEITDKKKASETQSENRDSVLSKKEKEQEAKVTRDKCGYDTEAALALFDDLSSEAKIDAAVRSASKIPCRMACGNFHFKVMSILEREKIRNAQYNDFLITTVQTDSDTKEIDMAIDIISYLADQEAFDQKAWETARDLYVRTPKTKIYQLSPYLLRPQVTSKEAQAVQLARLDELIRLAQDEKIGRPVPMGFDLAFTEIARGLLESPNNDHPWLAQEFYKKYYEKFSFTYPSEVNFNLVRLYQNLKSDSDQKDAIQWMTTNFAKSRVDEIPYKDVMAFVDSLKKSPAADSAKARSHKELYLKLNAKRINEIFAQLKKKYEIEFASRFCSENSLACPGLTKSQSRR